MDSMDVGGASVVVEDEDDEDAILNPLNLATAVGAEGVGFVQSGEFGNKLVLIIKASKNTEMEFTCVPNALKITFIQKNFPTAEVIRDFIGGDVTREMYDVFANPQSI